MPSGPPDGLVVSILLLTQGTWVRSSGEELETHSRSPADRGAWRAAVRGAAEGHGSVTGRQQDASADRRTIRSADVRLTARLAVFG